MKMRMWRSLLLLKTRCIFIFSSFALKSLLINSSSWNVFSYTLRTNVFEENHFFRMTSSAHSSVPEQFVTTDKRSRTLSLRRTIKGPPSKFRTQKMPSYSLGFRNEDPTAGRLAQLATNSDSKDQGIPYCEKSNSYENVTVRRSTLIPVCIII